MAVNSVSKIVVLLCATASVTVLSLPQPLPQNEGQQANFTNLKYTFGSKDEIPAAFFDTAPLKNAPGSVTPTASTSMSGDSPSPSAARPERRVYPPCQDGSGGMCVDSGTCPSDKRPETSAPGACASGQECCLGVPSNDRTCGSRGGECMPTNQCGSAPIFQDAEDCDQRNGQSCCILI